MRCPPEERNEDHFQPEINALHLPHSIFLPHKPKKALTPRPLCHFTRKNHVKLATLLIASAFILASTPARADRWDTLGGKGDMACASGNEECMFDIKTRYATLRLASTPAGAFTLSMNGKAIKTFEGYSIFVQDIFHIAASDQVLIGLNSGGMACPMELYIVEVRQDRPLSISESFGTCTDYYKASVENGRLRIRMPVYFNPMHLNDLTPRQRREIERRKDVIYTWHNARLTESRSAPRR